MEQIAFIQFFGERQAQIEADLEIPPEDADEFTLGLYRNARAGLDQLKQERSEMINKVLLNSVYVPSKDPN
jgi:hypothetical protein